jgi:hypothetical protein
VLVGILTLYGFSKVKKNNKFERLSLEQLGSCVVFVKCLMRSNSVMTCYYLTCGRYQHLKFMLLS